MLSKKLMKSALIAFSCMMLALPANTYAAGSNANQTISKTAAAKQIQLKCPGQHVSRWNL